MTVTHISMTFDLSVNTTLVLPMTNLTGTIDWGDGSSNTYINTSNPSKLYTSSGTYTVNINDVTNLSSFGSSSSDSVYLTSLTSFSYLVNIPSLTSLRSLFFTCTRNFTINFASNVTSNVTDMGGMFAGASLFDQPVTLDCSSCTNLEDLFFQASNFNSSLNLTNTSRVESMGRLLYEALKFNKPITLDCSSCTRLDLLLMSAISFNSSVNLTNTSKVTNMNEMFMYASSFNQPITLDCSSCTTLAYFLAGATSFNNTLNLTPIPNLLDSSGMIANTSLSTTNYSNLLTLWGNQPVKPNVPLTATGIKYNSSAQPFRTILVSSPNNWNIIDGDLEILSSTNFSIPTNMPSGYPALTPAYGLGSYGRTGVALVVSSPRTKLGSQGRIYSYYKKLGQGQAYEQYLIESLGIKNLPKVNPWTSI